MKSTLNKPSVKFCKDSSSFSQTLKARIHRYFKDHHKKKTGNRRLFLKAAILLITLIGLYALLLFNIAHWSLQLLLCMLLGLNLAAIGFNIMHDAGHDTFSSDKKLNTLLSYSLNLLGGNIYFWKLKHNIAHHTYTNIDGEDHDIEIKFMRIHPDQPLKKHHRYQRWYFPFLYSISYLAWIFYQDYEKYFRQRMGVSADKFDFPLKEKRIFWLSKCIHFFLFLIVPCCLLGIIPTLIGLMVAGMACGISLATIFQLAHVVTETEFKTLTTRRVPEDWMVHQIQSTANFATDNKYLTWLLGGLNFQVEHHLFPKVSHTHYPAINRIVIATCQEFNIPYTEFKTLRGAFASHVETLRRMSHVDS